MLADDDEFTRLVTADILSVMGLRCSKQSMLRRTPPHGGACGCGLLYTDVNMPGAMDGCDLAHAAGKRWPETKIIVCSGCTREEAALLPDAAHFMRSRVEKDWCVGRCRLCDYIETRHHRQAHSTRLTPL